MASVLPLLALVTLLTLPENLLAAGTGSLSCEMTDISLPTVENIAHQTLQIRSELTELRQQVETSLQDLKESVRHLTKLSAYGCGDIPTYSRDWQAEADDSARPREKSRVACNQHAGEDKMMMGISDDNAFADLDYIKCVHYDFIHLGVDRDVDVPADSNAYVNCGPNEVMTALGASDKYVEYIVRVTCTNITAGAAVCNKCHDITVTADQGKQNDLPDIGWPMQCPSFNQEINVITGIAYNKQTNPRWQKLRCCQLRRTLTDLP